MPPKKKTYNNNNNKKRENFTLSYGQCFIPCHIYEICKTVNLDLFFLVQ